MATIKKGTYRFNDDLNLTIDNGDITLSANLPFTVTPDFSVVDNSIVLGDGNVAFNGITVTRSYAQAGSNVSFIQADATSLQVYGEIYVQLGYNGWIGTMMKTAEQYPDVNQESAEALSGWGQTITVTADTEVDTTFATWFEANTKAVTEATPAVEITYKGETISLNSGETVTLHTAEKKLTADLVIKANEVSSGESVDLTEIDTLIGEGV